MDDSARISSYYYSILYVAVYVRVQLNSGNVAIDWS